VSERACACVHVRAGNSEIPFRVFPAAYEHDEDQGIYHSIATAADKSKRQGTLASDQPFGSAWAAAGAAALAGAAAGAPSAGFAAVMQRPVREVRS